ncbi:fumarylacetoacetase [Candidatus Solirubrobacter pratensis]|uniref:fumarylacetoacetase n=1 Tax=Candidatus Solirubrobacter pratensis TaxID=1298857 RepID=UPI00042266F1|nr:fumarylacetoacetase [Candidatus Solirubrobacter pratensis]
MNGFGADNLPYGVAAPPGGAPRCVVRYGDDAIDLDALQREGRLPGLPEHTFGGAALNPFLALGRTAWETTRARLQDALGDAPRFPLATAEILLPVQIGDYVDFYSSLEHASNLGRLFRPDAEEPLLPNWRHLPVAYHGRASSVVVSGTPIHRPSGQRPGFGPTEALDIELELGFITGPGNPLGTPIPAAHARDHVFGFVLVNDWSARDIQRWEYQPLGPFLGKSFATSISPWVVPLQALEPHLVPARPQEPEPLPYLRTDGDWALDIDLEIELNGTTISRTNARGLYWTFPQQLAHATVNGTNVRPGDLYASGTISGPAPGSEGSLIELGRPFLRDGDTVTLRGAAGEISLGEVTGTIRG